MTATALTPSRDDDDRHDPNETYMGTLPPPRFTKREIVKYKLAPRRFYDLVLPFHEMTMRYHLGLGTHSTRQEPPAVVGNKLSEPYKTSADTALRKQLKRHVDRVLYAIESDSSEIESSLDELDKLPEDISTVESNKTYSGRGAVHRHDELTNQIEKDRDAGHDYHNRTPVWLMRLAVLAPWLESVGFLAFISLYMDVPILRPWSDWFSWTFAISLVVIYILGQTYLVHLAAVAHNHAREERAKGNGHHADRLRRKRNALLGGVGVVALGITAGLVLRGQASLDTDTRQAIVILMFLLAATAGLLMPILTYLGRAIDGSKVSRERDGLADDLDASKGQYDRIVASIESAFVKIDDKIDELAEDTFPAIMSNAQSNMDAARPLYAFLRLQIGTLPEQPSATSAGATISQTDNGYEGWVTNGIPGAEYLTLRPLIERVNWLMKLRNRLMELRERFDKVSPHPWNHGVQLSE